MIFLDTFTRIVRPKHVIALADAERALAAWAGPEDPILLHGSGEAAVDAFAAVAARVGWGSAVAIEGVPTASPEVVDRAEEIARANSFRTWFRGLDMPGFPEDGRSWVKSEWTGNTYSSHLPYLLEAVRRTVGPVLELGSGDGSTPALHEACAPAPGRLGRLLYTVDSDRAWLARYTHLASETHTLLYDGAPEMAVSLREYWGVVFVDHAPGETRAVAVEKARNRAEYIAVHDSEDLGYGLEPVLSSFRYRKDFRRERPWTTVVSMKREIW